MRATMNLRLYVAQGRRQHPPVLQQAWQNMETGEQSWQNIPVIYEDPDDEHGTEVKYREKRDG